LSDEETFDTPRGATAASPPPPADNATPPLAVKVVGADAVAFGVADARAQGVSITTLRPVEAMLRDPLGEVARKERRSLLGISAIAILVGWTGLVPEKIENFGIIFASPERRALLWVFVAVVVYYTLAFIVYSYSDFLSYLHTVHLGNQELRRQSEEAEEAAQGLSPAPINTIGGRKVSRVEPWRFVRLVTSASLARGIFDFIVPLVVAGFAIWSLVGAVTQVTAANAPAAPVAPAASPK
jgi:hypothetical protein